MTVGATGAGAGAAAVGGGGVVSKEFAKHRMVPTREEVRAAIAKTGQMNLNKWLNKAVHTKL